MTRTAEIEGVGTLEFPDDTPDDVIERVVAEQLKGTGASPAAPAPAPSPATPPPATARPAAPPTRVAEQIADPWSWDAMKGRVADAGKTYLDLQSAIRNTLGRSAFKAGELALMPADIGHDVSRFVMGGDYSLPALQENFVYGRQDPTRPSAEAEAFLNKHTVAPRTLPGEIAENVNAAILGAKFGPSAPRPRPVAPAVADDVIAAGERHDVPVYYDDLTQSAFAKKLGVGAEYMPIVGTSAGRAKQAVKARDAAQAVTAKYAENVADDVPTVMQKGLQDQLDAFRGTAEQHYTTAAQLLDKAGVVPTPRFVKAIRRELANQKKLGSTANEDVVEVLRKFQDAPEGNFTLMRSLRTQLKGAVKDFYKPSENKAIGQLGVERLSPLREALEADMQDFAKKTGGKAYEAWKRADDFYKTNLVPFKERGFADLVRTAQPENAWQYLLTQRGIPSRVERMYNGLNESGRAAVRSGVINDAMSKAMTEGRKNAVFSPAKFARYMEDHKTVIDQFFKGPDRQEIDGFTNLMRHVERAGQHMENPPTGQRAIGALMLGSAAVNLKAFLIGAASAGGTRVLFQTQRGRDLLLAASKLKPGSPGMNVAANRIGRLMIAGSAQNFDEEEEPDAVSQ